MPKYVPHILVRYGKGDMMPNMKWVSVDVFTFFDKCVPVYASPGEVTEGDRPVERSDGGRWGGEVRV